MKKKNLLMILLGGMVMMPTTAKAQSNGDDNNQLPGKNRSPAQNPYAYITYDETAGMAYACFVSAVDGAEVVVYRDGEVVDSLVIDAVAGTQIPIDLSAYGTGESKKGEECRKTLGLGNSNKQINNKDYG